MVALMSKTPESTPETDPEDAPLPAAEASEGERVAKRLARAGIASRREVERLIMEGRVAVNGEVLKTPARVVTASDLITVNNVPVGAPEPAQLWRFHKPRGVVTSARDEAGRPTIYDVLPKSLPRLMPIGRLDLNSEGLLLLTNDGELKRRLELPANASLRRYRVRAHGAATERQLRPLMEGVEVEGVRYQPMIVEVERQKTQQQGTNVWLNIGIREGKNREIRRALEAVGMTVNRLIRVGYGPFTLGDLPEGAVEKISGGLLKKYFAVGGSTEGWAKAAPRPTRAKPVASKPAPSKTGGPPKPRVEGHAPFSRFGAATAAPAKPATRVEGAAAQTPAAPKPPGSKAGWAKPRAATSAPRAGAKPGGPRAAPGGGLGGGVSRSGPPRPRGGGGRGA